MIESTTRKDIFSHLSKTQILQSIISFCQENEFGLAAWRSPNTNNLQLIIDNTQSWTLGEEKLEELKEGFIFSPFDKDKKKYYLQAKLRINFADGEVKFSNDNELLNDVINYLEGIPPVTNENNQANLYKEQAQSSTSYESLVSLSIEAIKSGVFQKVVPSRFKHVKLGAGFNAAQHFINLEDQYKKSFVSFVYTPETNVWIGASPELLIQTQQTTFRTVALAGTQKHNPDIPLSDIAWTQKEIEEQAFVSRYIINCFKKIRLREFDENGPKTIVAGNLIHLKTELSVDMEATNFPQLGSVMLELLHPTSAICGMPLENAIAFIKQHEDYDRKFFSGYLGPVNTDDGTSIFVNLRCMEVTDDEAILYAGAGVTESSTPHKEWLETEMKMNTLLNIIKN